MTFVSRTGTVIEQSSSGKILNAEINYAEVHGALDVLEAIIIRKRDRERSAIYVLLGNSAAVQVLMIGLTILSS